jgi:hypothetical protein
MLTRALDAGLLGKACTMVLHTSLTMKNISTVSSISSDADVPPAAKMTSIEFMMYFSHRWCFRATLIEPVRIIALMCVSID